MLLKLEGVAVIDMEDVSADVLIEDGVFSAVDDVVFSVVDDVGCDLNTLYSNSIL